MFISAYTNFFYMFSKVVMAGTIAVITVSTAAVAETTARVKGQDCVSVVTDICPTMQIEEDASLLIIISITIKRILDHVEQLW